MPYEEPFLPESVEEQIAWWEAAVPGEAEMTPNQRTIQHLHAIYAEDLDSARHVWERIQRLRSELSGNAASSSISTDEPHTMNGSFFDQKQSRPPGKKQPQKRSSWRLLVALVALICVLLIGASAWLLNATYRNVPGPSGVSTATSPTTPTSPSGIYVNDAGRLARLDIRTGKTIWHTSVADWQQAINKKRSFNILNPILSGNVVLFYVQGGMDEVQAFNATTGAFLWKRTFSADFNGDPVVDEHYLYVEPFGKGGAAGTLLVIALNGGAVVGTFQPPAGIGQAWLFKIGAGILYTTEAAGSTSNGTTLTAFSLPSGEQLWQKSLLAPTFQYEGHTIQQSFNLDSLLALNGQIYVSTTAEDAQPSQTFLVSNPPHFFYAISARTGTILWKSDAFDGSSDGSFTSSSQEIQDNTLVVVGKYEQFLARPGITPTPSLAGTAMIQNYLLAFDLSTGKIRWQTSPTIIEMTDFVGDMVLALASPSSSIGGPPNIPNQLIAYDMQTGTQRWKASVPAANSDLGFILNESATHPTITLYMTLPTTQMVYQVDVFDLSNGTLLAHPQFSANKGKPLAQPINPTDTLIVQPFNNDHGYLKGFQPGTGHFTWQVNFVTRDFGVTVV